MSHPDIVQSALGDESVAAQVTLGDDALFVTPTRTLLYRADSLLSDESVKEFPHGAERIGVSTGRRKATISLDYGLDGERSFTVPTKYLDKALHPVLAGTLNANGVTDPGETVKETFRFSDLTLVVTSDRIVKHIGSAVWDEEFEEFHFDEVTNLSFEDGSVATTVVVTHDGRQERFKAPNEQAREVKERLTQVVLDHHGVDSLAALRERFADEEAQAPSGRVSFGEGPTPLSANPGELKNEPKNATRVSDSEGDATEQATQASGTVDRVPSGSGTTRRKPEPAPSTDEDDEIETQSMTTTADTASGEQSSGAASTNQAEFASGDTSDADGASDTGDNGDTGGSLLGSHSPSDAKAAETETARAESDPDVAALVAEVNALRESVDEQNERIARQEELIQQLIAELRERL